MTGAKVTNAIAGHPGGHRSGLNTKVRETGGVKKKKRSLTKRKVF